MGVCVHAIVGGKKMIDTWIQWEPKEDISASELAQAMKPMRRVDVDRKSLDSLPYSARRHWTIKERQTPVARNRRPLKIWLHGLFCHIFWLFSFRSRLHPSKGDMNDQCDEYLAEGQTATKEEHR